MNIVVIIFTLGLVILIHELGHFLVGKSLGIPIKRFSVGFGPALFKCNRKETEYKLSILPLGGYVLPYVENINDFYRIPVYKRILFSLGGPLANILTVLLLLGLINTFHNGFYLYGAFVFPFVQLVNSCSSILMGLSQIFTDLDQLSGIVGVVSQGSQFIENSGMRILEFAMIINLNLAIFNLLPFPILDGGKILMYGMEKIHPKLTRIHIPLSLVGWIIMIGLMVYITIHDIQNLAV